MKKRFTLVIVVAMIQLVLVSTSFAAPIHEAAKAGNTAEVIRLIELDSTNLNLPDEFSFTPLHWAANHGHSAIAQALLDSGADANAANEDGLTPLHFAAYAGHTETLQVLISHGAHVHATNQGDTTPLQLAEDEGHATTIEALQAEAVAQLHTQTAMAHTVTGNHALAARSHAWAAKALPETEVARLSYTRAAESHLKSKNDQAAFESYILAGILPTDIHTLIAEYHSSNLHGLDSDAIADRHVRAMHYHFNAADIHYASASVPGSVETAIADSRASTEASISAADASLAYSRAAYERAAVNADQGIQRAQDILDAKLALASQATANGNHDLARKASRQRIHFLVLKAANIERACRIQSKLESLNSEHAERLTRLRRH